MGQKITIICIEHGKKFLQEPRIHMRGHTGCSICQSLKLSGSCEKRGKVKTKEEITKEFIKRAQKIHGHIFDYSQFEYINSST